MAGLNSNLWTKDLVTEIAHLLGPEGTAYSQATVQGL